MNRKYLCIIYSLLVLITKVNSQPQLIGMSRWGGVSGEGTIFTIHGDGSNYQVEHSFQVDHPGGYPKNFLADGGNGRLYGLTSNEHIINTGVLFSIDTTTNQYICHYHFNQSSGYNPQGSLAKANNGLFYGITLQGGANNWGTLYSFDIATNTFQKIIDLDGTTGCVPHAGMIAAANGLLYGTTTEGGAGGGYGTLFSFNPVNNMLTVLYSFVNSDGMSEADLVQTASGALYGTTNNGGIYNRGILFSYELISSAFSIEHNFTSTSGNTITGNLFEAPNGILYGMTASGGANLKGTVFSFNVSTSLLSLLFNFTDSTGYAPLGGLLLLNPSTLVGITSRGVDPSGGIFSYDLISNTFHKVYNFNGHLNGQLGRGNLIKPATGNLFGMTSLGGFGNNGIIFKIDSSLSHLEKLADFEFSSDGYQPMNYLTNDGHGKYFGNTTGGNFGMGTIFSYEPLNHLFQNEHDFDTLNGTGPDCPLVLASDGMMYGTTSAGGLNNYGTIYRFNPASGVYTKLFDMTSTTGNNSLEQPMMQASDGLLYGIFKNGNILFSFDPQTSIFQIRANFSSIGSSSYSGLIENSNGKLYGTTAYHAGNYYGIIFSFDPSVNQLTIEHVFDGNNGAWPGGTLVENSNGLYYGITRQGGQYNFGVLYAFDPNTNAFTVAKEFNDTNGTGGFTTLMSASDNMIYGLGGGGAYNQGIIYRLDPATNSYTVLRSVGPGDGTAFPYSALSEISAPVSICEHQELISTIYPNPSNGFISVSINNAQKAECRATLYNVFGEKLQSKMIPANDGDLTFNLSSYAKGIYFLKTESLQKNQLTKIMLQ